MNFKPRNWIPVPTPKKPETFTYSVKFRNKDGSIGQIDASDCATHEVAIRAVAYEMRKDVSGPFLTIIQGGKK